MRYNRIDWWYNRQGGEDDRMTGKRSESRQRTQLVALRLLPAERAALEAAAQAGAVSLSEFIRRAALAAAKEEP